MTYASIMVAVDAGYATRDRVHLAGNLAERFHARLKGVAAEQPALPVPPIGAPPSSYALAAYADIIRDELKAARSAFDEAAGDRVKSDWRCDLESPLSFLISQAAAADLVVVGRDRDAGPSLFRFDPGDALMQVGRPLLVVPAGIDVLFAERIAIAWKNTREARRAVLDALPLLERAARVAVVSIDEGDGADGGHDVVRFLQAHGVVAHAVVKSARGASTFEAILDATSDSAADLIVAGAYGHGRLREWIFGGVTRDLLTASPLCCLLSR